MLRSLLLALCGLFLLSGCSSTRHWSASRTSPDELARVTETFAGEHVAIAMILESDQGRFIEALTDSTRWVRRDGSLRSVLTSEVRTIRSADRSSRAFEGVVAGLIVAGALVKTSTDNMNAEDANDEDVLGFILTATFAPLIIGLGLAAGASVPVGTTVWIVP